MKLYMFRTVPLSIISSLFTVHSAIVYVIQVCRQLSHFQPEDVQRSYPNKSVFYKILLTRDTDKKS